MSNCTITGCDRPSRNKTPGLCSAHYFRLRRSGDIGPAQIQQRTKGPCSVDDCNRPHFGHGYCLLHYRRVRKGGHPDFIAHQRRDANPSWKGDDAGYNAAHDRVRRWRGPARAQTCAACGAPARHWAYRHDDLNERRDDRGYAYSLDVDHYDPMCVPCHKRSDLERLGLACTDRAGALA
jgi:hypothetical protein